MEHEDSRRRPPTSKTKFVIAGAVAVGLVVAVAVVLAGQGDADRPGPRATVDSTVPRTSGDAEPTLGPSTVGTVVHGSPTNAHLEHSIGIDFPDATCAPSAGDTVLATGEQALYVCTFPAPRPGVMNLDIDSYVQDKEVRYDHLGPGGESGHWSITKPGSVKPFAQGRWAIEPGKDPNQYTYEFTFRSHIRGYGVATSRQDAADVLADRLRHIATAHQTEEVVFDAKQSF